MKWGWCLIFTMFLIAACGNEKVSGSASETTNGSIAGIVKTEDGISLDPSAEVVLVSSKIGEPQRARRIEMNDKGEFSFDSVASGLYTLYVRDTINHIGTSTRIEIDEGEILALEPLTLEELGGIQIVNWPLVQKADFIVLPELEMKLPIIVDSILSVRNIPQGLYSELFFISGSDTLFIPMANFSTQIQITKGQSIILDLSRKPGLRLESSFLNRDYVVEEPQFAIVVRSFEELKAALNLGQAHKVFVEGMISGDSNLRVPSNFHLYGLNAESGFNGFGLRLVDVREIVLFNLHFENALEDGIDMDNAQRVLIESCTFSDAFDDQLAITHGSDSIAVVANVFAEQESAIIIGNSDNTAQEDSLKLNITFAYNVFEKITTQVPRVRFGTIHLMANSFSEIEKAMIPTKSARIYSESNFFHSVKKTLVLDDTEVGVVFYSENDFLEQSGSLNSSGEKFDLPYSLILPEIFLETKVKYSAGARYQLIMP